MKTRLVIDPMRRFLGKIYISKLFIEGQPELGPCELWRGGRDKDGYGQFNVGHQNFRAHRWRYEQVHGPVADQLDHICRIRSCVALLHLRPITLVENVMIGMSFSAINARKTHCNHGHEFTESNTYIRPDGRGRECKLCRSLAVELHDRNLPRGKS